MHKHKIHLIILGVMFTGNVYCENSSIESSLFGARFKNTYVGGGLGPGINYFNPTDTSVSAVDAAHASMAYKFFVGYNLNKNFALELGYNNFGYYSNSAGGNSVCNTSGDCGFPVADLNKGLFNTRLNVVNSIDSYAFDFSLISRYNLTENFNFLGRIGVSYLNATLDSTAIVSPQVLVGGAGIGPTIIQNTVSNEERILPIVGVGYEYRANNLMSVRFEYDYYFGLNMVNNLGINEGTYSPSVILMSVIYNL